MVCWRTMFKESLRFTAKLVLGLAMLSLFAYIFYVTPVDAHASDNNEITTCLDNRVSISNYRDQHDLDFSALDFKTVTPLNFDLDLLPNINQLPVYNLNSPPNKIALYIQHNALIL